MIYDDLGMNKTLVKTYIYFFIANMMETTETE